MKYSVLFYTKENGERPVCNYLDSLPVKPRAKLVGMIKILEDVGRNLRGMQRFDDYLNEQLKDPEFKKEYDALQPEFEVIRAIAEARASMNLTQQELSKRTGINQADISKLENGTRNPSVRLLQKLAEGMDMTLKIEFVPKKQSVFAGQK